MSLDPLITLGLMLLLWGIGIGYIVIMAAREARTDKKTVASRRMTHRNP
ncbi:hypothetical protein RCO27_03555 [Sphingosinicella sp. LHD-64]|nr:hypothetical protein [Sphingosinicella sp. LHD-64]MDQ8755297.1 hypothetical protein [Sphingosinicella sp. LHD-64]